MATIRTSGKLAVALSEMAANLSKAHTLRVGFLEGATYPDGTPVALVAAILDGGAPARGIPPRPFFRNMVAEKSDEWPEAIGNLLKANEFDADKALSLTGMAIKGQLEQSIVDTNDPPLAQSTIDRKGSAKPLVDTGHMLKSVDYEVKS